MVQGSRLITVTAEHDYISNAEWKQHLGLMDDRKCWGLLKDVINILQEMLLENVRFSSKFGPVILLGQNHNEFYGLKCTVQENTATIASCNTGRLKIIFAP